MKYVLLIGDGMADNPVASLGGKTPLEYADISAVDALCAKGMLGSVKTVPDGLPPGSDTAILSIFGNDPRGCYTGRSPLEAAGAGIELFEGDTSYRCNMVTLSDGDIPLREKKIFSHSGGSVEGDDSFELISFLIEEPEFKKAAEEQGITIFPSRSFRHIAVQKNAKLNGFKVSPPHDVLSQTVGPHLPCGCTTGDGLKKLMEIAARLLDRHPVNCRRRSEGKLPANGIWFWAEGTAVMLGSFEKKYKVRGAVISAVPLVSGIGALGGLAAIPVEGATGELDTNYAGKADAAVNALLNGFDFVGIHVEAPDECTHNGDTKGKIKAIELISSQMVGLIAKKLSSAGADFRLLFLSDHKTLTSTRGHDADPVPFMIYDSRKDISGGRQQVYTEKSAQKGIYLEDGSLLMDYLFERI